MNTDELRERVFALVRQQVWHLRRPPLTPATHLADELGLDSLERVQLGIRLEYGLGIEIPDTELGQWRTLADVLACVERQPLAATGPAPQLKHFLSHQRP